MAFSQQRIPANIAYGPATKGGTGGRVIKVTNLNNSGAGSFREAVAAKGPRIIVFEVSGVIDLDRSRISIQEPFITIAGQTAPAHGITFIKGGIDIKTHDVIVQHISVRPGDAGAAPRNGWEPDGMATLGKNAYNIIVDHCSLTWAVDENLSASGPRTGYDSTSRRITFSNNIIAESLYQSSHTKGIHSMGSLVHDFVYDIAIVGNLYACNNQRNPLFKGFTKGAVINNVIYNPGTAALHLVWHEDELKAFTGSIVPGQMTVVGNVLQKSSNSSAKMFLVSGKGDAYLHDNKAFEKNGDTVPQLGPGIRLLTDIPSWPGNYKAIAADSVLQYVLKHAGARPAQRNATDQRIIDNVVHQKGELINSQEQAGGYPVYTMVYRKLEVPDSGVEAWLQQMAEAVE